MPRFLNRIARDNTTLLLLAVLIMLGAFITWQLARLPGDENSRTAVSSAAAGGVSVADTVAALEKTPVSRPHLALLRWQTANGARVYFVPAPELPMLDVRVVFDGGAARDGGLAGLARFTSAMIGEGTTTRSVDAINNGFEKVGAQFSASSYRDMAVVELRTLTRAELATSALELFTDALSHPSFPRDSLERIRNQILVGLERDEEEPATIAARSFMAALYLAHPYATPPEGTVASVRAVRVEDLKAFHGRYYVARNAVIAITGAVDRARAEQIATQISTALAAGEPAPKLPPPPDSKGGHYHVKFDSQQTHAFIGLPALQRADPDEAALSIANEILGGNGLNSLLAEEIRNKRGLAYSVGSSFQGMRAAGPFVINLQTRNEVAGAALGVSLDTLRRFIKDGPTQAQLDDARRQLVGGYPLQLAGNQAIVGTLGMIGFYNLPDDYPEQQVARIEQASREDVRLAFARHVPADRLIILTLGPEKPTPEITPAQPAAAQAAPTSQPSAPHKSP